ncbi:discoidin domain-containing protein [Echinicola shivajiensis]|uniref:discoidin domain-containing protein n=1 Tax=Echinicola shivajiensis TaxID=1035916 RepID=UPI001BFC983B|nr:discoidin domain-containing protein [Echinicola shivajiensis]
MKRIFVYWVILLGLLFNACSTEDMEPDPEPIEEEEEEEPVDLGNYVSDYNYNLNVVYFVPSDIEPLENYHQRLSGVMLYMEDWYKKEMASYGFPETTFGLLKSENDPSYVKVIVIRGKGGQDDYPYSGGGGKAGQEIREYFNAHPEEEASAHTLVFMPSRTGENGWDAGGVPFYGLGKWCYALDYKNFDMKYWQDGSRQSDEHWIGGTIHELGHGLNLPHNKHKATDDFISMMAWGNHEINKKPNGVHLTFADALILANNQVMSKDNGSEHYQGNLGFSLKSIRINADNEYLYVNGRFESDIAVNGAIVYNDPKTNENDADYNAVTWGSRNIINGDSISFSMPLEGIDQEFYQYPFEMRVRFCHENGNFTVLKYGYEFENGRPNIDVELKEIMELPKSAWNVIDVSSEELVGGGTNKGAVDNLKDGDEATFWHSVWYQGNPPYPHHFTIDLGKEETAEGMVFSQRLDKYNGRVKTVEVEISSDGDSWEDLGEFNIGDSTRDVVDFSAAQTFRYIKVTVTEGHDNESGEDVFFTHLAEFGLY